MRPLVALSACVACAACMCAVTGTNREYRTSQQGNANEAFSGTQFNVAFGDIAPWAVAAMTSFGWGWRGHISNRAITRMAGSIEAERMSRQQRTAGQQNAVEGVVGRLKSHNDYAEKLISDAVRRVGGKS